MFNPRNLRVVVQLLLITIGLYYVDKSTELRKYIPFVKHRKYQPFRHLPPVQVGNVQILLSQTLISEIFAPILC